MTKRCIKCSKEKEVSGFESRERRVGVITYGNKCKICISLEKKEYYKENKTIILSKQKSYHKNIVKDDLYKDKVNKYRLENRHKYREYERNYKKNKRRNDTEYRLRCNLRARTRSFITQKSNKTIELIGCTSSQFRNHLQKQFDNKMTWENYGSYWHIDHIKPLSNFILSLPCDRLKACHFSNCQPLEAKENRVKGNK